MTVRENWHYLQRVPVSSTGCPTPRDSLQITWSTVRKDHEAVKWLVNQIDSS